MYIEILLILVVVAEFFYFRKQIKDLKVVVPKEAPAQTRDTFSVLYGKL